MEQALLILTLRCSKCHDVDNLVYYNKPGIMQRAVIMKTMPPGNVTNMTEEEREVVKQWLMKDLQKTLF